MNQGENESLVNEQESDKLSIELYKTAFARLNFQDEYLFKFSTVFLTVYGFSVASECVIADGAKCLRYEH